MLRDVLLSELAPDDLPSHSRYGDGTEIEPEVLDDIRQAYDQETIPVGWQQGDLLMIDNLRMAHGRLPFLGERRILFAMSEPCRHPAAFGEPTDSAP